MTDSVDEVFLRGIWRRMQSVADNAMTSTGADELRRQGAGDDELRSLLNDALARLAWDLTYFLDMPDGGYWNEEPHTDVADDDNRWQLSEVRPDGSLTGEVLDGLHEIFMQADPSGNEGSDWGLT